MRCEVCGFRKRGKEHNNGQHHQKQRPEPKVKIKSSNKRVIW